MTKLEFQRDGESITAKPESIVIYHGNCADGFAAAWCFWKMAKDNDALGNLTFHPGVYQDAPPNVAGKIVFLVDFSYKRAIVEEMLKTALAVFLIDHHKTAIEDLEGLTSLYPNGGHYFAYTDLNRSGAMLAWDWLNNVIMSNSDLGPVIDVEYAPGQVEYELPPKLLEHVQDRDLWRFAIPGTREIQANLFSFPYDFKIWDDLMRMNPSELEVFKEAGAAIERKHFKDIGELLNATIRHFDIAGYTVPVANVPYTFASDAGHIMAEGWHNGSLFAACYYDTATHRVFSLRSTSAGLDVSDVAKQFGGGGHSRAAGFRVVRDHGLSHL